MGLLGEIVLEIESQE
uniref:Disintegrin and metalloproteinase domain-containing protein 28 isoform x2 n=1 Tax=Triatoma infestans TaxID=30076 RepID=A0A170WS08_TRIIF